jgi:putative ABC transport system substrate-binding protein
MNRRAFIVLSGGAMAAAAICPPSAARAQSQVRTIGLLGSATASSQAAWVAAFVRRLRELGWIEGRNIRIEQRWAEGQRERHAEFAAEFVRLNVDVIFAMGTEAALAAKEATQTIPIVFPVAGDPVANGIVASLARPGGNVTGLSNLAADLAAKRIELAREIVPGLRRMAILFNAASPNAILEMQEFEAARRSVSLEDTALLEIRRSEDIAPALQSLQGRANALYVVGDPLMNFNRVRINTFALVARLPTIFVQREYVEAAGLMSYGASYPDLNRRAADYVDKILRGAKPADLPVEQPTKFELVINLVTAQALGLTVPATLLATADEVIE